MRRLTTTIAGRLLTIAVAASSQAFAGRPETADSQRDDSSTRGFDRFLRRYEAANTAFVNGDPTLWLSLAADVEPVSIFGGFGGLGEAGIEGVHQRYLLAATAFQPSGAVVSFEYLAKDIRGRLAYTVAIERAQALYAGHTERQPQILRSTMLFRFDRGGRKIIHRHADTMIHLQLPTEPAAHR
jgi:hypothetical protein